jgi:hypothetical protein
MYLKLWEVVDGAPSSFIVRGVRKDLFNKLSLFINLRIKLKMRFIY